MRFLILFVLLAFAGCKLDESTTKEMAQLRQEIRDIKQSNDALKNEISYLKLEVSLNSLALEHRSGQSNPEINLTDKSYSIVSTELGNLLLSVQDVAPFANGVKIEMHVGNPQALTFSGLKFTFSWKSSADQNSPTQTKEIDLPQSFLPGAWNRAEMVISPAKVDDIANVRVSVTPDQVSLHTPPNRR